MNNVGDGDGDGDGDDDGDGDGDGDGESRCIAFMEDIILLIPIVQFTSFAK